MSHVIIYILLIQRGVIEIYFKIQKLSAKCHPILLLDMCKIVSILQSITDFSDYLVQC